ncbi:replication factor A protein 3 [Auricularia subglabra TFB-10046 SS5]|uniref:Replication factor A protein 3 n=1 Tax=Auricularia subglabra (strain TFB-10046 / SS5) TaxID=717982 RepID=J0DC35_AURST|nr:replication factor A protein 3 [Auricularia subglabra TFB-10046 SS5]
MSELVTPRINSSMLEAYVGRKVKLVGRAPKSSSETALIQCSDGGQVEGRLVMPFVKMDTYVEIVCTVESAQNVSIFSLYNMGDDIALDKIDKTIVYAHDPRFKHLFEAA